MSGSYDPVSGEAINTNFIVFGLTRSELEGPSWSWSYGSGIYTELPMQSVPITTDVVSSNLDQGEMYNIIW